jgi:hypothetical protein
MDPEEISLPIPGAPIAAPGPILPAQPAAGGLLPIPGPIAQTSTSTSTGSSQRVATPGLAAASEQRRAAVANQGSASAQRIGAAESEGKALQLRQEAENLKLEKQNLIDREMARQAKAADQEANRLQLGAERSLVQKEAKLKSMDTETFWGGQETWRKVLWGISLALGGYGAALSKGGNPALERLNKTMDDWSAQRQQKLKTLQDDITSGRAKVGTVGLEYLKREQELEPLRRKQAMSRAGDHAEREYQALVKAGNTEAAARAQKLVADIRAEEAKLAVAAAAEEEKAQQFLAPTATKETKTGSIKQGAAAGGGKFPIFDLEGKQVGATDQQALANDAAAKRAGTLDSRRLGAELSAHVKKYGMEVLPGGAKPERDALVRDLISALVKARSGTAASDKEREALQTTVMPGLINQALSSRGNIAKVIDNFVSREVNRYADFAESSTKNPSAARAAMGGGQPPAAQDPKAEYKALIEKAKAAGDKATVEALTKEMNGL